MNTDAQSPATRQVDRLAVALLGFAAALTVFLLVPPYLLDQVGSIPGFTGQEAADVLTPIVSMPLLALALELTGRSGTRTRIAFVALAAAWVAGQGIHLAANAIGDVFPEGPVRDAFYATPAGALDHFLDESLSHWLWHLGWAGLLLTLFWAGVRGAADGTIAGGRAIAVAGAAGLLHGFTWFVVTDEGETWPLAIPVTVALLALAIFMRRADGPGRVVTVFLVAGSVVTLVLYALWVGMAGWPPGSIVDRLG